MGHKRYDPKKIEFFFSLFESKMISRLKYASLSITNIFFTTTLLSNVLITSDSVIYNGKLIVSKLTHLFVYASV